MRPNYSPTAFDLGAPCFVLRDVLDAGECAALIRRAEATGIGATASDYPPSYRDNDRLVLDDSALAAALFARVRDRLPSSCNAARLNERFRVCRYRDGQCFRVHRDGAHAAPDGARSWLTLQIYLNDAPAFRGGATRFYASRTGPRVGEVRPEAGMAVVFAHDLWHDGEAVTAGTKYVLRTDVMAQVDTPEVSAHSGYVFAIAPLNDGGFATGSRDRTVRIWERAANGARCVRVLEGHRASVIALAEACPRVLWSGARDHAIRAWNLDTGESRVVGGHEGAVLAIASLDAELMAIGGGDGCVRLWSRDGEARGALAGHAGWVWAVAPIAPGYAVSGSEDGTLRLWSLDARAAIDASAPGRGPVHALTRMRDGLVVAGFADGSLVAYALASGRLAPTRVIDAHRGEVYALAAIDGDRVASGGEDDVARVHRLDSGAASLEIRHDGFVRAIAPLAGGVCVSGGYDGAVRVWSTATASIRSTKEQ